jgi:hypothetical protein
MSLMRGDYENAAEYLQQAAEAYGAYGRNTSRWYEWSLRVISARLATRRGKPDEALAIADRVAKSTNAPRQKRSSRVDRGRSAVGGGPGRQAEHRLTQVESRLDPRTRRAPGESSSACAAICVRGKRYDRGLSRHRAELERLRACRRSDIKRRSARWRWPAWPQRPERSPPPIATINTPRRCFRRLARRAIWNRCRRRLMAATAAWHRRIRRLARRRR